MNSNSGNQMHERTFFNLSAIAKRIQEILQPHVGKLFWVKAEISSGRERGGSFYCDLVETDETGKIIAKMNCSIWNSDLMQGARDRRWVEDECRECVHFNLCGGGCPLEQKNGAPCRDSM